MRPVESIANTLARLPHRAIIAVDGVDGAGKTTFADWLRPELEKRGRRVVRASLDGFHNPKDVRYRRGRADPMGYFLDSFNYADLKSRLLDPFRSGLPRVDTTAFDYKTDRPACVTQAVPASALLVFDGIFLHRDEIASFWDFGIFLDVPNEIAFGRLAARDGFDADPAALSNRRYREGQEIYMTACKPKERADLVIASGSLQ